LRIKEQEKRLTLNEHDDDDELTDLKAFQGTVFILDKMQLTEYGMTPLNFSVFHNSRHLEKHTAFETFWRS